MFQKLELLLIFKVISCTMEDIYSGVLALSHKPYLDFRYILGLERGLLF